jgi:putative transposase
MAESTIGERAYRMRCYPSARQRRVLGRLFGASRFVWNWALARRTSAYQADQTRLNWVSLSREFTALRQAPQTHWLCELPREPFKQVLRDQERALQNFFARRARYPRFRRRGGRQSVRFTLDQRRAQVEREATPRWAFVDLPGLGSIKLRRSEVLQGRLRSVTLSRDGAGRYFASIGADRVAQAAWPEPQCEVIGIDLGIRDLAVVSDGEQVRTLRRPKALALKLTRLRRYQRRQSRQVAAQMRAQGLDPTQPCPKGVRLGMSGRRARTRARIARLHGRIGDLRRDALHRVSTALVGQARILVLEDLNVQALSRGGRRRGFRRAMGDVALGELRRQIRYKAAWAGRQRIEIDRFYPSSQRCFECGALNSALGSAKRWECPACGACHDRDENAAKNIRAEGMRQLAAISASRTGKRPGTDARGVACAAQRTRRATAARAQRRPTQNRELAQRPARAKTARVLSGTAR